VISFRRQSYPVFEATRIGSQPFYAIGDVHGCYDLLRALLTEIARDSNERQANVTPLLILLGDYVDRGPASKSVLDALIWLSRSAAIEVRLLEGNHEAMLLGFIEDPIKHGRWLSLGGAATLQSYGVHVLDEEHSDGVLTQLRDELLDKMPASHYQLLRSLELMVEVDSFAFVHAGILPGVALKDQDRDDMLWIRDEFLNHPKPSKSVIIHGHTWKSDQAVVLSHRVGIDTGAYETGVLTAISVHNGIFETIQAVRHVD
jgi:serine/threonine protein phosphatase 1